MHGEVVAWKGPLLVEALDGGEELNRYLLVNILGQVVVPHYAVSSPKYCLVMELIEHPQGLRLPSLTFANSL